MSESHLQPSRFLLSLLIALAIASPAVAKPIPKQDITRIEEAFREAGKERSTTAQRRAYKRVIRSGESLIRRYPDSDDRFKLLNIVFRSQRLLLEVDDSEELYEGLFKTAKALSEAPMTIAELRLPADILLLQVELADEDVTDENRIAAIKALARQYKGSKAEARCIMNLILMAKTLKGPDLFRSMKNDLIERFKDDPDVKYFLREKIGQTDRDIRFSGIFKSVTGNSVSFPVDTAGHNTFIVFWSTQERELKERFEEVKKYQKICKGLFKIYSFNLDQRDDAGRAILDRHGLNWEAMILPDGANNKTFRAYGYANSLFSILPCNATGYSLGKTNDRYTAHSTTKNVDSILSDAPYLALIRSLAGGHFLISEAASSGTNAGNSVPAEKLKALHAYFPKTQILMRQDSKTIIANYEKAVALCDTLIKTHPDAADLWRVRNARIIAFMGLWKVTLRNAPLKRAVEEAKLALRLIDLTPEAKVIPRFCLAKDALRQTHGKAAEIITAFIASCGGEKAPASAYALGLILAVDGGQDTRDLYITYRRRLVTKHGSDKTLWPLRSYLMTQLSSKFLFEATTLKNNHRDRTSKYEPIDDDYRYPGSANAFTTTDGKKYSIPDAKKHAYHLALTFDLPKTAEGEEALVRFIKELLFNSKDKLVNDRVKPVFFILSDDRRAINAFLTKNRSSFKVDTVVSLKGGTNHPFVTELGLYMPEESVNTTIIAPNGDIVNTWSKLYRYGVIVDRRLTFGWTDSTNPEIVRGRTKGLIFNYAKLIGQEAFDRRDMKLAAQHLSFIYDHGRHMNPFRAKAAEAARLAEGNFGKALNHVNHKIRQDIRKRKSKGKPAIAYYELLEERIRVYETFGRTNETVQDRRAVLEQLKAKLAKEQGNPNGVWAKRYTAWIEHHESMMKKSGGK